MVQAGYIGDGRSQVGSSQTENSINSIFLTRLTVQLHLVIQDGTRPFQPSQGTTCNADVCSP